MLARYKSLWRDSWWAWLLNWGAALLIPYFFPEFRLLSLFLIPAFIVMFLWFGFVRYDDNGDLRS